MRLLKIAVKEGFTVRLLEMAVKERFNCTLV